MGFFGKVFRALRGTGDRNMGPHVTGRVTSGDLVTEMAGGANLVDGKNTWELAEDRKHDLEFMKKCCDAELATLAQADLVPAPYYFERVAILSRKAKDYGQEVAYCEKYIRVVEDYYRRNTGRGIADVRDGPTYRAIVHRLVKARDLLAKQRTA